MRKTVLMVTHDVSEAVYLSNRICVMSARPGRIVEEFNVDLDRTIPRETLVPLRRLQPDPQRSLAFGPPAVALPRSHPDAAA